MISIPLPTTLSKRMVGATGAAAILVGVSAISAIPASASNLSSTFSCTPANPDETCVSISYLGTHVYSMTVQGYVNQPSTVAYVFEPPFRDIISGKYSGGPGWLPSATLQLNQDYALNSLFCGDTEVFGGPNTVACVRLP
jgi:hypothetical protein